MLAIPLAMVAAVAGILAPGFDPTAVKPLAPARGPSFEIVDWRLIPASDVENAKVAGEVRNIGTRPMGVQLQAVVRDQEGRVVDTDDFWPASIEDIAPGKTFAFSYHVDARPQDKVELRIVSEKPWK